MKFSVGAGLFKKIIESVKDVVKDISLEFSPKGISLSAMDSSHVALIHMEIMSSLFTYQCMTDEIVSLQTETLSKIIKTCENESTIFCENEDNKLHYMVTGVDRQIKFTQNQLDLEVDSLMPPSDMNFPCQIFMPCVEFQKMCRDLREFGDDIKMMVSPQKLLVYTESAGEHIEIDYSKNNSIEVKTEACFEMTYNLKYLSMFCKACALTDSICMKIGMDQPMCLKFSISTEEHLSFYLAPKVD